jgi:selenophosphate synthase
MSIRSISNESSHLYGWTPTLDSIREHVVRDVMASTDPLHPCGCSVKLDLERIVYRTLNQYDDFVLVGHKKRVDSHSHLGRFLSFKRCVFPLGSAISEIDRIRNEIVRFEPESIIELFTTSKNQFTHESETVRQFEEAMAVKLKLFADVAKANPKIPLSYGKGHSIGGGADVHVFDLLRYEDVPNRLTFSNQDTIITADSLLKHHSPVSVFVALNNAFNDLFVNGVSDQLRLFPILDGSPAEVAAIEQAIELYVNFFSERGVPIVLERTKALGRGAALVGATVVGESSHRPPSIDGLLPGQEIICTRFLGDLSVLSDHKNAVFSPSGATDELSNVRLKILQRLSTPNILLARVVRKYLPSIDEAFDQNRHITFATDLSGPGVSVIEEGAIASGVDVYIDSLRFVHEPSLKFFRRNHTASTNGPLVIAAMRSVLDRVVDDLLKVGLDEVWFLGKVLPKSGAPTIYLNPYLKERFESADPRTDLFAPEVHFGKGQTLNKVRVPIFRRFAFQTF